MQEITVDITIDIRRKIFIDFLDYDSVILYLPALHFSYTLSTNYCRVEIKNIIGCGVILGRF